MRQEQFFYEFFVRGEFEDPTRLGELKGAFVQYWPMAVGDDGAVVMRSEIGSPRPLALGDVLPAEIAAKINQAALASVNTLTARNAELEMRVNEQASEIEALKRDLAKAIAAVQPGDE